MRIFFVTLVAFIISVIPLAILVAIFYFLGDASKYIGIPVSVSYFLYGAVVSYNRKYLTREYKNYWDNVWYKAGDRL